MPPSSNAVPGGASYIHGTAADEQDRLATLNGLINARALSEMALQGSERILDAGCGLAQFTRAMANAAGPDGYVLGIERSPVQLEQAWQQMHEHEGVAPIELRQGDVLDMPLAPDEWNSFDVAHARFILEHVRDPLAVVQAMVQAVRPGGRIVLQDDDHDVIRLHPEPTGFTTLWQAYVRSYDRLGNDPYIGRRLVTLLHDAGAPPMRNTWLFFGSCSGDPHFRAFVMNTVGLFTGARDDLAARPARCCPLRGRRRSPHRLGRPARCRHVVCHRVGRGTQTGKLTSASLPQSLRPRGDKTRGYSKRVSVTWRRRVFGVALRHCTRMGLW